MSFVIIFVVFLLLMAYILNYFIIFRILIIKGIGLFWVIIFKKINKLK